MNAGTVGRQALGAALPLLLMLPTARHLLEQRMLTHMLFQMPALGWAGMQLGASMPPTARCGRWNAAGVPALLAASLIVAFWMTPIAIDHAVADLRWDVGKAVTLVMAGAAAAASWRRAPTVVQAFFVGNMAWMSIAVGSLYQDEGPRLCNAYLQDDQAVTGIALTGLAIAAALLWLGGVSWPYLRVGQAPSRSSLTGTAPHET